ncbi:MAG: hypothetical protein FK733_08500 [Asgard group archaeon]|nr:hypothetical protein [Asgard group archaeon]
MKKMLCRLFVIILLVFSTVSNCLISIKISNTTSSSQEPIHNRDCMISGIVCGGDTRDIYYNNDFLFLEKGSYHNYSLEIFDVSTTKDMTLVKTFDHQNIRCDLAMPQNCLSGNDNYTFLSTLSSTYGIAIVAFDINSAELAHVRIDLPDSNYMIIQHVADNDYLYLVRDHYNLTLDWQIEKYEINYPFSLSLVSNVSVSRFSQVYTKSNQFFIFNVGDINNWTNSFGSESCYVRDAFLENNKLLILMSDNSYKENYFSGLLVLDVIDDNNFQVLANYSLSYVVNLDVIDNNIFLTSHRKIVALKLTNNDDLEEISSYSFENIYGDILMSCSGKELLFLIKESCCCRHFAINKMEDEATLVIFNIENPSKIKAVYPRGFDNRIHLFADYGFFIGIAVIASSVIGLGLIALMTTLIIKKIRKQKKII